MLTLSLVWLVGGFVIGALGCSAALRLPWPARGGPWQAWGLVALGGVAGLVGGWIGTLVFGTFFGSPTAVWVAVLAVVGMSWAARVIAARRSAARTEPEPAAGLPAREDAGM